VKVVMQGRIGLLNEGGGDKVQIENTALELRKLGVEVDISTNIDDDIRKYDLVHIFQLDWIAENYFYAKEAYKFGKPIVLSPIHHNINEVKRFDDDYAFDLRRLSKFLFKDQFKRDIFKNLHRSVFDHKKIKPTSFSLILGLKEMHRRVLAMSDKVLVQTELEAKDIIKTYQVDIKWKKVPNGVGEVFLHDTKYENSLGLKDYILCVGRIEARKNQIKIIEAVEKFRLKYKNDVQLVFVGHKSSLKHFEFVSVFNKLVSRYKWIKHIEKVSYENMPSIYKFAKVCVSASWFETTGLTLLEALFCNTNAVASGPRAKEYLGSYASYCDPNDIDSIFRAIEKEYFAQRPSIPSDMREKYTWSNAAKETFEVYKEVLKIE